MTEGVRVAGAVARWLAERGVPAREGWSGKLRPPLNGPTVVVTVRGMQALPGALARSLGEAIDEETGGWREFYGRRLTLELGLDLYAPEETGQEELGAALDALAKALSADGPPGLRLEKLTCGEIGWDKSQRVLRQEVSGTFSAWLEAGVEENETFLEFELRGGWKC